MADETTEDYDVKACARGALSDNEWRRCVEIIAAGGAVAVNGARLRAATTIVLARKGSDIVGVGTIKGIRKAYAAGIAGPEKSGYAFPPENPGAGLCRRRSGTPETARHESRCGRIHHRTAGRNSGAGAPARGAAGGVRR